MPRFLPLLLQLVLRLKLSAYLFLLVLLQLLLLIWFLNTVKGNSSEYNLATLTTSIQRYLEDVGDSIKDAAKNELESILKAGRTSGSTKDDWEQQISVA